MNAFLFTFLVVVILCIPYFVMRYIGRDSEEAFLSTFGFWCCAAIIGIIFGVYSAYQEDRTSPVLAVLKKGQWECIHSHTVIVLVGKILVPEDVCDTYQSADAK